MLYEFRPASLESAGLVGALEQRLSTVESRAGIDVSLSADKTIDLSPQMEQEVYQIAIEALNNSLKHAEATAVAVDLHKEGNILQLDIQDNGRGFDASASSGGGGMGLNGMRERARILGGELLISSTPGKGSLIRFKAPFPKAL